MRRPMVINLAPGNNRRALSFVLIGLLSLTVGYIGQGFWDVGRPTPAAASAIVTDVVGGAGSRKSVRILVSLAITNTGTAPVQVFKPESRGDGTEILALTPSDLRVDPDRIGRVDADVTLDCDRPEPLQLADLQLQLTDGARRPLQINGAGMVLEACSRASTAVRPLAATTSVKSSADDGRLAVRLSSPTGRAIDVLAVRAGGVDLAMSPTTVTLAGKSSVVVRLTAPTACPTQWRVTGIPSAVTVDLRSDPATDLRASADSGATVRLRLGSGLTSWLLDRSCPERG
jgi:hypothetical protein